jgi:hypothetical protein
MKRPGFQWGILVIGALAMLIALSNCASTGTIPRSLLTCPEEPVYQGSKVTVKSMMAFTDEVAAAGADCRSKVKAIKKIADVK